MSSPLQQIVHGLRQPLSVMEACIWHLRSLVPATPETEECLARMERQVFEASRILGEATGSYPPDPPEATNSASASLT